jgi:hypothetical protein
MKAKGQEVRMLAGKLENKRRKVLLLGSNHGRGIGHMLLLQRLVKMWGSMVKALLARSYC